MVVFLCALGLQRIGAATGNAPVLRAISGALADPVYKNIGEIIAAVFLLATALLAPRALQKPFRRARQALSILAFHKRQAILFAAATPMVIRLALLPVLGVPDPLIADEFGYLLIADTFASGRLANPPHPLWQHFETIYAFHQPMYASIYPIAPALLLIVPKLLGITPWLGVWLGAGLMCALICWMLQGWVPPKWALLGALLAVCRFAIIGPWMNTYWGGASGAAAGALLLGALPRIMRSARVRDTLLFGMGLALLAQTRPYEGLLLSIPILLMLAVWFFRARHVPLRIRTRNIAFPLAASVLLLGGGTAYYNWRLTGDPLVMPYGLHQKIYGTPQSFYWQEPIRDAPGIHRNKDIAQVFQWQLDAYESQFSWESEGKRLLSFWNFYLHPLFTVPLLMLPLVCRNRQMLLLAAAGAFVIAGNALYPFFFPHYAAPLCGLLLLLIVQGLRYLHSLKFQSERSGRTFCAGLLAAIFASAGLTTLAGLLEPWNITATATPRGEALKQLRAMGGKHLVLVRYSPEHSFHYGVVYNDADLERSGVIWARELDEASNTRLLSHFKDRRAWWFNPDEEPVSLTPVTTHPFITVVAPGAGKRDDTRDGVSPGSVALVMGGNFAGKFEGTTASGVLGALPFEVIQASAAHGNVFARRSVQAPEHARIDPRGDLSVHFGAIPARILGVSNFGGRESITVQAPSQLAPGWTSVTLRVGSAITSGRVRILRASPGIFQMRMSDSRVRAIVLRADGSVVNVGSPARRGEILRLYATGLGPFVSASRASDYGASAAGAGTLYPLIVGVNHHAAKLLSVEPAPGTTGIAEVAFEVPADAPSGADVALSLGTVVNGRTVYSNKSSLPVE
jgi:uncharacterized protein (TIGR03437 family)